jgi:hypothetical protein
LHYTKRVWGTTSRAAGYDKANWFQMDSLLLHVGLLTDREKIATMFFQEQEQVEGDGA